MGAEATATSILSTITGFASAAIGEANGALAALGGAEVPFPSVAGVNFPPATVPAPNFPATPDMGNLPDIPEIDPVKEVQIPDEPSFRDYSLGNLLAVQIPAPPQINIPELNISSPDFQVNSPKNWAFVIDNINISGDSLVVAIKNKLRNNILNGGTGLVPAIEEAIWNRDLERLIQASDDATDKLLSVWAKKGFSLPDGLLANSVSDLQKEFANKRIDRSREISIEQAKLEQTNLFKSLDLAVDFMSKFFSLLIQYEELVLKVQEFTAKYANEYIDLQIKTYMSLVEAYKAEGAVYESKVRASISKVEIYKAQIEGQKLIGEVNEQTVKVFSEQIRSTLVLAEIYKTKIDAVASMMGVEKVKIEAAKARIDAWAAEANVKIAEYNGKVEGMRAFGQVSAALIAAGASVSEANMRSAIAAGEVYVKSLEAADRISVAGAQIRMEAARGVAQAAASLAAGAMAAMSAHANVSYSETKDLTP